MIETNLDSQLKECKTCKKLLPLTDYHKEPRSKDKLFYSCKNCYKIYRKNHRKNNPLSEDKIKEQNKKDRIWYQNNKSLVAKTHKLWKENNPRSYKNTTYKAKYGISIDEYEMILKNQDNSCAVCKIPQSKLDYSLAVDHCHITNKVRGLLCRNCNLAIGYFKDNTEVINNSITYLEKFKEDGNS